MLKGTLIKVSLVIFGNYSTEIGLAAVHFARQVRNLAKRSGWLFVALYLKQCSTSLMRYYSWEGDRSKLIRSSASVSVSLTRSGLPRIIPPYHRKIITRRDHRADRIVRVYLSFFSLSKVIKLAKPISRSTFDSIIKPQGDIDRVKMVLQEVKESFPRLQRLYLPWVHTIPCNLGLEWIPSWKILPNSRSVFKIKTPVNPFTVLKWEISSFALDCRAVHSLEGIFSPYMLFNKQVVWPLDNANTTKRANW